MHLPEIDRYSHLNSFFHRLDPRLKLLSLFILLLGTNLTWKLIPAGTFFLLALFFLGISRLPAGFIWWHLRAPLFLALVLGTILALLPPQNPLHPSTQNLLLALLVDMKILGSFIFFLVMVATSPLFRTLQAARSLGVPEKLLALFLFTYRYLFVLLDHLRYLRLAMLARGFRERTDLTTYTLRARLYALLFWRAFEETERILLAMYARGLGSSLPIRVLPPLTFQEIMAGIPLLALSFALLGFSIFW